MNFTSEDKSKPNNILGLDKNIVIGFILLLITSFTMQENKVQCG